MGPSNPPATVPGPVVLLLILLVVGGAGLYFWLRELEARRSEDFEGVEEWEQFKRDAAPMWPRSLP